MKVYGPYTRKDKRMVVVLVDGNKKTTQSYPRYLVEQHLGRKLLPTEHIDHIDNDKTNNSLGNLQVISALENLRKEICRPERRRKYYVGECPMCGINFTKPLNHVKANRKKGKSGPFCSRQCAGKHRN